MKEQKTKEFNMKNAKWLYFSVFVLVIAIFSIGIGVVINNGNSLKIEEQNAIEPVDGYNYGDTDDNDIDTTKIPDGTSKIEPVDGYDYTDGTQYTEDSNPVGVRDLLMFATLAYEPAKGEYYVDNGEGGWTTEKVKIDYVCPDAKDNSSGKCMIDQTKMVGMKAEDYQLLGNQIFKGWQTVGKDYYFAGVDKNGNTEYYASVDEVKDWAIVNYISNNILVFKRNAKFEATTFRLNNDIVIAYRGTDFTDLMEWMADVIGYGVVGLNNYEKEAKAYAKTIIEKYTKEYKEELEKYNNKEIKEKPKAPNFYITGHSLGGYLSQVGAESIISGNVEGKEYLRDVVYFNGMGLNPEANFLAAGLFQKKTDDNERYKKLLSWANGEIDGTTHRVICYNIKGDPVSSLGSHVQRISFYAAEGAVRRHLGVNTIGQKLTRNKVAQKAVNGFLKIADKILTTANTSSVAEYSQYYNGVYGATSIFDQLWYTHEPSAGLFYNIKQEDRGGAAVAEIKSSAKSGVKADKPFALTTEVTGEFISCQWYKNDQLIEETSLDSYQITEPGKATYKALVNYREPTVGIITKETKSIWTNEFVAVLDTGAPKVTFTTSSNWKVKRKKDIVVTITCTDESGFKDGVISSSDLKLSGLVSNLKIASIKKVSSTSTKIVYNVTLRGNIIGLSSLILNKNAVSDIYGTPNNKTTSKTIRVTLI